MSTNTQGPEAQSESEVRERLLIELAQRPDWQTRVLIERAELGARLAALSRFIASPAYLTTVTKADEDFHIRQRGAMSSYLAVLDERIAAFPPVQVLPPEAVSPGDTSNFKALQYWQAIARREQPLFVPEVIYLPKIVYSEGATRLEARRGGIYALSGEHLAIVNAYGAVSVTDNRGGQMGLRLQDFEVRTWRAAS